MCVICFWAAVSALWAFLPSRLSSFYCILLFYMLLILSVSTNKIYTPMLRWFYHTSSSLLNHATMDSMTQRQLHRLQRVQNALARAVTPCVVAQQCHRALVRTSFRAALLNRHYRYCAYCLGCTKTWGLRKWQKGIKYWKYRKAYCSDDTRLIFSLYRPLSCACHWSFYKLSLRYFAPLAGK